MGEESRRVKKGRKEWKVVNEPMTPEEESASTIELPTQACH
jgi:hypothetical protein